MYGNVNIQEIKEEKTGRFDISKKFNPKQTQENYDLEEQSAATTDGISVDENVKMIQTNLFLIIYCIDTHKK